MTNLEERRQRLLADGEARTQRAVDELAAIASKTRAELLCEAILKVITTIDIHRHECSVINEFSPGMAAIYPDDLARLLRLRLAMADAYEYWNQQTD